MSLSTSQTNLLIYYLLLYFATALVPSFLLLGLTKKHLASLVVLALLIAIPIIWDLSFKILSRTDSSKPYPAEQVNEAVYLERIFDQPYDFPKKLEGVETLKNILGGKNFCFKVFLPDYLPIKVSTSSIEIKEIYVDAKKCENQMLYTGIAPYYMYLVEIPKNYDFNFRKGFEDLNSLRTTSLSGTRLMVNGKQAYLTYNDYLRNGFRVSPSDKTRLLYWETENTIIFFQFTPSREYSEEDYLQIANSMKPINWELLVCGSRVSRANLYERFSFGLNI